MVSTRQLSPPDLARREGRAIKASPLRSPSRESGPFGVLEGDFCRNAGVFETGFHFIPMPYPNRDCETESLFMRLAEEHAEVFETILQPYGM